jgi:hypothetical protein
MTVETRYFRNQQQTVNGLTSYMLELSKYGAQNALRYTTAGAYLTGDLGIRVYKRDSAGVETEITPGSPVAVVTYYDGDVTLEKSNTWDCPETSLANTDNIVVRIYARIPSGTGTWALITTNAVFSTGRLGASKLDAATWTVYYTGGFSYNASLNRAAIEFDFDGAFNSRIENFTWTPYVPPPAGVPRFIGDGLAGAVIIV